MNQLVLLDGGLLKNTMPVETIDDKELKITLNTNDQDTFSFPIKGVLDSVIINTNNKAQLIIQSELGYDILVRPEIEGINYLVPRARTTTAIEDLKDFPSFEPFNLNERVGIIIIGPPNTIISFIFRLK